ncbi:KAP family P-loop NTPase fold protein [Ferrimonas balearica]|uniref:KAP family P-loop NTPase fold protein n=1 Tax=Ferrimonas balearica TaxID=44012 RepID=UPI001C5B7D8F|nr:KAP family NTPase [Ferrimonas balearica]MBW3166477.1 KAP family NTPase [Ferrimonas balearica]
MTQLQFQGEHGRDEFQREAVAAKVISLLTSPVEISPMVIDGDWGTGKTEFCHKLINKFNAEHDNYQVVYVDAFQADHADDPLMTILAEVIKLLPEGEQRQGFIQKALPVARYGLKTLLKAGAGHILRQDADNVAEGLEEHLKDAANKAIDASVEAVLKDHEKAEESLKALQTALADIAADSPIVLFIDELDRCRPDFAVQMLEVIKHTFDVEGVQFVLVTNTTQLKAAINHCYGHGVDARRYLDKFLKFSFGLPPLVPTRGHQLAHASVEHYRNQVALSPVLKDLKLGQDAFLAVVTSFIARKSLSLREVETFVRHLEIYHVLSGNEALAENVVCGYRLIRAVGVLAFCFDPALARSLVLGDADATRLGALLGVEKLPEFDSGFFRPTHEQVLAFMLGQECALNAEAYAPRTADDEQGWSVREHAYFQGDYFPPEDGEHLRILTETISLLGLKG